MNFNLSGLVLKMVEKVDMPESLLETKEGKKSFVKTGNKIPSYGYTFIDSVTKEKFYFVKAITATEDYSRFENKDVDIQLGVTYNDYGRKYSVKLLGVFEEGSLK